ncbi:sterol desaturase/sphingolipid hydroxylase (fatty acid hydroxylase superfamily) [Paraperlucidibaca baekdonensis]|uniref:Sterol desaturase/sphingolipid hydroxylase (Fatty acid hydroxylase superfamily) n=1 Tax=Paraperlucidibaca baekdonensis TaxID=748120 RepID=A0A3E0H2S8_9GAMM|nr:sterol desaturase family protein [Paraperlucidibaca baekdonensis]REH37619.1 sterol desaturase/sphingolipid hydroxylase (fatty acid hydroxylase superfamily) [Paraperlucidibaca baekdonensis]
MQQQQVQGLAIIALFGGFAAVELLRRRFFSPHATREDNRLDLVMGLLLPLFIVPAIILLCNLLGQWLFPDAQNQLADWPIWLMIVALLLSDDLTQYWWHRLSHTSWMWPFHRAHHAAAYMGVRVVYRNNFFYYLFMPGLWASGIWLYLGFGWVYVSYAIVKMAVIIGAHSEARWDEKLYAIPALRPLMWLLERTISTPATHFAHHALSQKDGIGHYTGNYGNLLFFWDVLFGTAHITRQYPPAFGLPDDIRHGSEKWQVQVFYPLLKSSRAETVLSGTPVPPPEA